MVNDHIQFGGGGDAVFRLERSCYEDVGHEVFTFSQAEERPLEATSRDYVALESGSRIRQKVGKFLKSARISAAFGSCLQAIRPHFVSVHLVSKYPLSIYPRLKGYSVVQTLHGPNLFCASSWGCLKDSTGCELGIGLKCFRRGCVSLSEAILYSALDKRLQRSVKQNVNLFVCPSEHIRDSARSLGFAPVEIIPYGIDDSFLKPPLLARKGPPIVLYVGRLSKQKGVDVLLYAFQSVVKQVPNARLLIAGSGSMSDCLRRLAANCGLNGSVSFTGFVEHSEVGKLYEQATVLAVPSIWKEQFGLIGPEALACGTPCVASDIGGIPEWLHDGKWGFLVPPHDSAALADKILLLLQEHELRQQFAKAGREYVIRQYSPDKYRANRLRLVEKYASDST